MNERKMDVCSVLEVILLGAFLGAVGQGVRVIVGIKKKYEEAIAKNQQMSDWFEMKRLVLSLIIGAIAGSLGAITLFGTAIDQKFLITLIAIGYAGTDFIEGFMRRYDKL